MSVDILIYGFTAALIASLFSGLGGILIYCKKQYTRSNINFMLNMAAGIMLSSSVFNLLVPAIKTITSVEANIYYGAFIIILAIICGVGVIWILHEFLPHEHEKELLQNVNLINPKSALLFVFAIALHKLPEGIAIGVSYGGFEYINPLALTIGMALQNIPEGLMVATSLFAIGFNKRKSASYATLTGLIQPLGSVIGVLFTGISQGMIPFGMALAGGTMLFVIINEVLPETYDCKRDERGTLAIVIGFIFMTYLSIVLE